MVSLIPLANFHSTIYQDLFPTLLHESLDYSLFIKRPIILVAIAYLYVNEFFLILHLSFFFSERIYKAENH
jgi:hypothetical protein